jgi:hypothetical protein
MSRFLFLFLAVDHLFAVRYMKLHKIERDARLRILVSVMFCPAVHVWPKE